MKKKLRKVAHTEDMVLLEKTYLRSVKYGLTYGQMRDILFKLAKADKWKSINFFFNNVKIRKEDTELLKKIKNRVQK